MRPILLSSRLWALAALALMLGAGAPALAQGGAAGAAEADRAISQLRSPYCPGLMLEVCPSPEAAALRDSIRAMAASGEKAPAIVEWMIERHGEEWRAVPKRSGTGMWAWLIPPLFLLLGIGLVVARLRSRGEPPEAVASSQPEDAISGSEQDRLAMAMREWEADSERE